jgi:predicted aspartyl protease
MEVPMNQRVVSARFPYLTLHLFVRNLSEEVEALLDTGFDGDVTVPDAFVRTEELPDFHIRCTLADGSGVVVPAYLGEVSLNTLGRFPIVVTILGDESLVGRGITDRFTVILDHGQQGIVEP